jgi:hypothetical protein
LIKRIGIRQCAPDPLPAVRDSDGRRRLASAEDIDAGMVAGCAHPMGPLALTDLIGLDTAGRKTGRGFFSYR